jgi:hypothetical protein
VCGATPTNVAGAGADSRLDEGTGDGFWQSQGHPTMYSSSHWWQYHNSSGAGSGAVAEEPVAGTAGAELAGVEDAWPGEAKDMLESL